MPQEQDPGADQGDLGTGVRQRSAAAHRPGRTRRFAAAAAGLAGFTEAYREQRRVLSPWKESLHRLVEGLKAPTGPRGDFEGAVAAFGLTDDDLLALYRRYIAAGRLAALLAAVLATATVLTWMKVGAYPGLICAVFLVSEVAAFYLCALRARAIRQRRLPDLPRAWRRL